MRYLLCSCMAAWWLHTTHNKQHTTHSGGCGYGLWSRPHDYTHHIGDVAGGAMRTALYNCQCSLLMVGLADSNSCSDLEPLASRREILSRRRQLGAPAPEVELRRGWFLTQIGAADRGGQLDLKVVRGLLRGLSALHNTVAAGPLVEKDLATAKPNARRMECDCEGASGRMMMTLACDGC